MAKKDKSKMVKIDFKPGKRRVRFISNGETVFDFRDQEPPFEVEEQEYHTFLERDFDLYNPKKKENKPEETQEVTNA